MRLPRLATLSLLAAVHALGAEPDHIISVSGEAEIKVVPDEVTIVVGIETLDRELAKAKKENDDRLKRVIAAAKAGGVEDKRIATDSIQIEPEYSTDNSERRRVVVNYLVRRTVQLVLRDVPRFDDLLAAVVNAGANLVHNVSFTTTELRKHRDHARELAMKAAHEKAAALAGAEGLKLRKPRSISEQGGGWSAGYGSFNRSAGMLQNSSQNASASAGNTEGASAPGLISVSASVSVVYDLE
jgi:uncharacterized protein